MGGGETQNQIHPVPNQSRANWQAASARFFTRYVSPQTLRDLLFPLVSNQRRNSSFATRKKPWGRGHRFSQNAPRLLIKFPARGFEQSQFRASQLILPAPRIRLGNTSPWGRFRRRAQFLHTEHNRHRAAWCRLLFWRLEEKRRLSGWLTFWVVNKRSKMLCSPRKIINYESRRQSLGYFF